MKQFLVNRLFAANGRSKPAGIRCSERIRNLTTFPLAPGPRENRVIVREVTRVLPIRGADGLATRIAEIGRPQILRERMRATGKRFAGQGRAEAAALHLGRDRQSSQVEQRGSNIHGLHERGGAMGFHPAGRSRIERDQGNPEAALIVERFAAQPKLANASVST
jgi:hypothetical protein